MNVEAKGRVKVNMNGSITSNGRATDREIGFVMEARGQAARHTLDISWTIYMYIFYIWLYYKSY